MLVDQILSNEGALQEINLTGSLSLYCNDAGDLVAALKCNNFIETISCGQEFLDSLVSKNELDSFIESLGTPKNIKFIAIDSTTQIKMASLAKMFENACALEQLSLNRVDLVGTAEDFSQLRNALWKHESLQVFELCKFVVDEDCVGLDEVFKALASLSSLSSIRIVPKHAGLMGFTGTSVMSILKSPSLRKLDVSNCKLEPIHFKTIAWSLPKTQLEALGLSNTNVTDQDVVVLAPLVSILKDLDLSANPISNEGCAAIGSALQQENACLKRLDLTGCKGISSAGFATLAMALEGGKSKLEELGVSATAGDLDAVRGLSANIAVRNSAAGTAA